MAWSPVTSIWAGPSTGGDDRYIVTPVEAREGVENTTFLTRE